MSIEHHIYSCEDLANIPDDGNRYEIIAGELIVSPAPTLDHQRVVVRLSAWLTTYVWEGHLGQVYPALTEVRLSPHNSVQPDILFISEERFHIPRRAFVDGAPDLVVEVLSDRTRGIDLVQKRALYAMAGVPEYWIVDLKDRTVSVLRLVDGQYDLIAAGNGIVRSLVVPGFELAVADVFADLMAED